LISISQTKEDKMKVIRSSVFETNSSSMHSLAVRGKNFLARPDKVYGSFGEFGWGYERLTEPSERLSYILTDIARKYSKYDSDPKEEKQKFLQDKYYLWVNQLVKDYTGNEIEWDNFLYSQYYPFGYIDHQSIGSDESDGNRASVLEDFWSEDEEQFKENMKDFIFNERYTVIIDNDNHGTE
jgi:hypothetical protein